MADYNLGTARGRIDIDASGAKKGTKDAEESVGRLGTGLDKFGKSAGGLAAASGIAATAGGAVAGAFALAVNSASDFEKRMSAVKAVSGATDDQMKGLSDTALRIGKDTSFSANEAGQAIEELVKAGISVPDVMNGAADATVALAAAGEIALPDAAAIASNAMNQFGLSAKQMPGIADQIAGAANASAIDVSDFGMSLSQAGAVANLAGLDFKDTAVAIAEMGNAGIKGSDAGTSLKTFLQNLQPSTKKQTELFKQLGLITKDGSNQFYDAAGNLKSMKDIQDVLAKSTAGMTAQQKQMALETLFGSDAIRAAAVLADNGAAGFDKMSDSMGKVTAASVAAERLNNLSGMMENLKGSVETVAIQIGNMLIPYIKQLVSFIQGLIDKWNALSPATQKVIVIVGLIVAAVLILIGIILAVAAAVAGFVAVFAAVGSIALPIIGVVAAIVAVIAIIVVLAVLIYTHWAQIKAFTISVWNSIAAFFVSLWGSISGFFVTVGSAIAAFFVGLWNSIVATTMAIWNGIVAFFVGLWNGILSVVTTVLNFIVTIIMAQFNIIRTIFTTVVTFLMSIWSAFWNGPLGQLVQAAIGLIIAIVQFGFAAVRFAIQAALAFIRNVFSTVWNAIVAFFRAVWATIVGIVGPPLAAMRAAISAGFNAARAVVSAVLSAIRSAVSSAWAAVRGATSAAWNAVRAAVSGPINAVRAAVSAGVQAARSALTSAWNSVKSVTTSTWNSVVSTIRSKISSFMSLVSGIKGRVVGALRGAGSWLVSAGRAIIQGLLNGITAMIGRVTAKLHELTSLIPKNKGPERVDKKLLQPNGEWIIGGLMEGIANGVRPLEKQLGGLTYDLPGMVGGGQSPSTTYAGSTTNVSNGPTVNQHIKIINPYMRPAELETNDALQLAGSIGEF